MSSITRGHRNPVASAAKTVAAYAAAKVIRSAIDHPGKAVNAIKSTWKAVKAHTSRPPARQQIVRSSGASSVASAYTMFRRPYIAYRSSGNALHVTGCEVVIPSLGNANVNLTAVVPHNPAYWLGTRIQVLAKTYQLFHIDKLLIHYIPRVATSTAGSVTIGTISTELPFGTVDSMVLANSLGGVMGPVWGGLTSQPDLRNTPLRYYNTYSPENSMDWAYMTAIAVNGNTSAVGTIMFEYRISMVQPLWDGRSFAAYGLHQVPWSFAGVPATEFEPAHFMILNSGAGGTMLTSDVVAVVVDQTTGALTRPSVNCMSVLSVTFGVDDSASSGWRKVYLSFGGHELVYTGTGNNHALYVILYSSEINNTQTLTEPPPTTTTTTTPPSIASASVPRPAPPFPNISESNKQAWDTRLTEPSTTPPQEWARRSASCGPH